jgi:hypothetical protein
VPPIDIILTNLEAIPENENLIGATEENHEKLHTKADEDHLEQNCDLKENEMEVCQKSNENPIVPEIVNSAEDVKSDFESKSKQLSELDNSLSAKTIYLDRNNTDDHDEVHTDVEEIRNKNSDIQEIEIQNNKKPGKYDSNSDYGLSLEIIL